MSRAGGRVDAGNDDGAAVVDFALVGALLTVLFLAVLQVGVVVHVKNTLVDCAAEGARLGARADRTPDDGVERTRELVASELSGGYAARLTGQISAGAADRAGVQVVEVRIRAPLPVIGLIGPSGWLTVRGSAFDERQ
jgi:Flp pilus assembly protein TadG